SSQITLEAWVRLCGNCGASFPIINMRKQGVSLPIWNLEVSPSQVNFGLSAGAFGSLTADIDGGDVLGRYAHIAGTYNGNMLKLYLNGQLVASGYLYGSIATGATDHNIA